ncbi:ferredoxin [Microtetraspora malaysiensis]|jgi:ferredoxin
MMRVYVDRELCQTHAQCVFAAPDVFELDENDELHYVAEPDESQFAAVEEAALLCPVQAISFRD